MGCGKMCGCGKKSASYRKTVNGGSRIIRPSVGPTSSTNPSGATPEELRALGLQANTQSTKINSDKRRVEKLRREAIKKAFNK